MWPSRIIGEYSGFFLRMNKLQQAERSLSQGSSGRRPGVFYSNRFDLSCEWENIKIFIAFQREVINQINFIVRYIYHDLKSEHESVQQTQKNENFAYRQ
jgi:hypothetical protein